MDAVTAEIVRLCEMLPEGKRATVADFIRFLAERTERSDDLAWERLLADPAPRPRLEAFLRNSADETGRPRRG